MRTALIVCSGVLGGLVCTIILFIAFVGRDRRPALDRELYVALEAGDTNYLQSYVDTGGDVNRSIRHRRDMQFAAPLLYYAIRQSQPEVVDLLLKNRADPNKSDSQGDTPLIWISQVAGDVMSEAPFPEQIDIFKRLLEAGADPNLKTSSQYAYTPLMEAAATGRSAFVRILLEAKVDINATNTIGDTALHLADNAHVARVLLDAGADPRLRTVYGETAAEVALRRSQEAPLRRSHFHLLDVLTNAVPTRKVPD
jgi:uncharacterized protein